MLYTIDQLSKESKEHAIQCYRYIDEELGLDQSDEEIMECMREYNYKFTEDGGLVEILDPLVGNIVS